MTLWLVVSFLLQLSALETIGQHKYCETICPINEVFSSNVSQCQNTCYYKDFNTTTTCSMGQGCVCRQGFIRHQETYQCIPLGLCQDKRSSKQCPTKEFYSDCDAGCQRTCRTRNFALKCTANCVSACACRTGFIRHDVDYQCIPEQFCQSNP